MKVFKFGGASVKDADGMKNVASIIEKYNDGKLLVVVSALGKTTNALEDVVKAYISNNGEAKILIEKIKQSHFDICTGLFEDKNHPVYDQLNNFFVEMEWQIEEERMEEYNYVYDQIVSVGELLSTTILSNYINQIGIKNTWVDVRDVIKTDDTYREGNVNWLKTTELIEEIVLPILEKNIIITQGFLGSTPENCTTTLGREGSDYTAAIFTNILNAKSQTIWKDVPGVLSGDPRKFTDAVLLEEISYLEAVEMTFYGASVIHPKTIKPLQNKGIPLLVKSFIHPENKGTIVGTKNSEQLPPVRVVKEDQCLLTFHTKNFSFIAEEVISDLLDAFAAANFKLNMMQNGAISFQACVDNIPEKIAKVKKAIEHEFDFDQKENLTLLTIRHYTEAVIANHKVNKKAIIEQKRNTTWQGLLE
jgi:aspartate kinase